ncbi:MAG: DUF1287 domain-containing protein [Hyphomicrobiaceae bacterium]
MSKKSRSKRPRGPKQTPARKVAARKPASATPSGDLRPAHRHDAEAQKKRATLGMLAAFLFLAVGLVAYEGLRGRVMHWLSPPLTADATKLPPIAAAKPTPQAPKVVPAPTPAAPAPTPAKIAKPALPALDVPLEVALPRIAARRRPPEVAKATPAPPAPAAEPASPAPKAAPKSKRRDRRSDVEGREPAGGTRQTALEVRQTALQCVSETRPGSRPARLLATEQALAGRPDPGFGNRLAAAALKQVGKFVVYDAAYRSIAYPMGDVPSFYGVCTDVVIRAYRDLGIDLQQLVAVAQVGRGDTNIDHRRVEVLRVFFERHGTSLPVTRDPADYRPGDIVTYHRPRGRTSNSHIAIVSSVKAASGRLMIVHNRNRGPKLQDALFDGIISGHYRFHGAPALLEAVRADNKRLAAFGGQRPAQHAGLQRPTPAAARLRPAPRLARGPRPVLLSVKERARIRQARRFSVDAARRIARKKGRSQPRRIARR